MFFLIGHRGVGKSSLVSKIEGGVDLDQVISSGHSIDLYFENNDEAGFRKLEKSTLQNVISKKNIQIVALGAGFELDDFDFPKGSKIVWIQRRSDAFGRVFLDRPRLNLKTTPSEEYLERFEIRQKRYQKAADLSLELIEGSSNDSALEILSSWLKGQAFESSKAFYTLGSTADLDFYSGCVELRTDILTEAEISFVLKNYRKNNYIVALRSKVSESFLEDILKKPNCQIDAPLEDEKSAARFLNKRSLKASFVLSSHGKLTKKDLKSAAEWGLHIKWAPIVKDFNELVAAYKMIQNQDVSFLPRSENAEGTWKWMRETLFHKNKINFYRSGVTSYMDQVHFSELESIESEVKSGKGAVLGENVYLSRSPGFHSPFFFKELSSFYSQISMARSEFNEENFNFIRSMGYSYFSVTAPFKDQLGFLGCEKTVNTLACFQNGGVGSTDTDRISLRLLAKSLESYQKVLIWGAGSMGRALSSLLGSKAVLKSVRDYDGASLSGFDAVVWCSGVNSKAPLFAKPPSVIFDLEYKESARGRQVAFDLGTAYISGEDFFKTQAEAQQNFWLKVNKDKK